MYLTWESKIFHCGVTTVWIDFVANTDLGFYCICVKMKTKTYKGTRKAKYLKNNNF